MVKRMACIIVCGATMAASCEQYTNIMQVLNTPLTTNVLIQINEADASTPDRLFLAFMKACAQGQLSSLLSLFTDAYIASEFGVADKNAFTNEDSLDFRQFFADNSVTGKVLSAYSCVVSGNVANVSATIRMYTTTRVIEDDFEMGFTQTNGVWRISRW